MAAILVLVYHVIEIGQWKAFPSDGPVVIFRLGWVGVDLFFVISGFVIALSALNSRHDATGQHDFLIRRLARIAPLYWLTMLVSLFLVEPTVLNYPWLSAAWHVLSHLGFVHNLFAGTHGSINGPNWSVGLEMQFYLLIALIVPWLARWRPVPLLVGTVAIGATYRWVSTLVLTPGVESPMVQHVYVSQLPGTIDQFAFGIVLALVIHKPTPVTEWLLRPSYVRSLIWLAAGAAVLYLCAQVLFRVEYWSSRAMMVGWRLPLSIGFALLVAAAICLPNPRQAWTWPMRYLGNISYGIYLWHLPVLLTLRNRFDWTDPQQLLIATIITTVVLAAISWHAFESPLRSWLTRKYTRSSSQDARELKHDPALRESPPRQSEA